MAAGLPDQAVFSALLYYLGYWEGAQVLLLEARKWRHDCEILFFLSREPGAGSLSCTRRQKLVNSKGARFRFSFHSSSPPSNASIPFWLASCPPKPRHKVLSLSYLKLIVHGRNTERERISERFWTTIKTVRLSRTKPQVLAPRPLRKQLWLHNQVSRLLFTCSTHFKREELFQKHLRRRGFLRQE